MGDSMGDYVGRRQRGSNRIYHTDRTAGRDVGVFDTELRQHFDQKKRRIVGDVYG